MPASADPTKNGTTLEATNENTPLLGAPESGPLEVNGHATTNGLAHEPNGKPAVYDTIPHDGDAQSDESMPYFQIILLCYASVTDPIAFFSIVPFISEMIATTGEIPIQNVGFYAGLIESLFSLVQMVLMIFYGRMADRLGRKPVLVFSLAGVSGATVLFGLSRNLWQMVLFRCIGGCFAGSVVTVRSMISENTNKKTQGRAFSWYMFSRNIGILIGPLVGGGVANPAKLFPDTFGGVQFFIDYPYALPTFIAGGVCLSATLTSLFFVKETLKPKDPGVDAASPKTTLEVLRSPGVPMVLFLFGTTMTLSLTYTAILPVFLYTYVDKGGYGLSPTWISYYMALAGAGQATWMLLAFPPLQRTFGTGRMYRACATVWPMLYLSFPAFNEVLRHGYERFFWIIQPPLIVLSSGVAMAFACMQLCLNDIAPSPDTLGTVNALSLTVGSGLRAFLPAMATSLYAVGVRSQWADGHLIWVVFVPLALLAIIPTYMIPEAAEGRPEKNVKHAEADADQEHEA